MKYTCVLPYNDKEAVYRLFLERGDEIAAVIIEPVACNMGVVLPEASFLQYLREVTQKNGALLLFDEVITGFRLSAGGAQQLYGIWPDLTTVGKIVGGGFPAAAFGGRADIMALLAPDGPVYQAGTLAGNPIAMSAGIVTLNILREKNFYEDMAKRTVVFYDKLRKALFGKQITLNCIGPMFTLFFTDGLVNNFTDVKRADQQRFAHFFRYMLEHGFYISPSQFEGNFLSISHTSRILDKFIDLVATYD